MTFTEIAIPLVIGLFSGLIAAGVSARAQMKAAALSMYLVSRLEAYKALENAFEEWADDDSNENINRVFQAANAAALVATPETIALIGKMQNMVRAGGFDPNTDTQKLHELHIQLIASMRKDLLRYPVPRRQRRSEQ